VLQEIKRSGYDGLLRPDGFNRRIEPAAGMRSWQFRFRPACARSQTGESVGLAEPAAFAGCIPPGGLAVWGLLMGENEPVTGRPSFLPRGTLLDSEKLKNFLKRLLP
jgi:hypothetical protein